MKFSISSLFVSHKQNSSSMNLFHVSGLLTLCLKISFFYRCHKDVGKSYCHFSVHGSSVCLKIVFPVKLEGVLLQYKAEHFSEEICSYRRVIGMKVLVCVVYYSDSFLLWDIRVEASDIH